MTPPEYRLLPAAEPQRSSARRWAGRVALSALAALTLILAAFYGPVLWNNVEVTASPSAAPARIADMAVDLQAASALMADQETLAELYTQVAPSVVNIQVTSHATDLGIPGLELPDGGLLQQSQGSGFMYDDLGHIVTNNHVVEGAESLLVVFSNGHWAEAEVVAADEQADLAVIKVTPPADVEWRPLPLAEPDSLRVGYTAIAIGNPFGLDGSMTTGIISALGRGVPVGDGFTSSYTLPDVIQTDAAINPGNSGGPLVDLAGRVVGVNFAIRSQAPVNAGVSFAIPVSIVQRVVPALIQDGRYAYAYLGLTGSTISAPMADMLGLPDNRLGVYVAEVIPGGPSAEAGVAGASEMVTGENGVEIERGGDVITAIDGQPVQRFEDLVSYLVTKAAPGQTVTLSVTRGGETLELPVVLGERPATAGVPRLPSEGADDLISAREAIEIAVAAVQEAGLLTGEIAEKVAAPHDLDGMAVWIVELSTADASVVVTIDAVSGEVLEMTGN